MCRTPLVQSISMIFVTARDLGDIINRAKFCIGWLKGFGHRKGQIWGLTWETLMALKAVCCTVVHTRDECNEACVY